MRTVEPAKDGRGGYAHMRIKGQTFRAHRLAWIEKNGPIPPGLFVLHKCDVRHCVNPDHLFLGTQRDNTADMMAKGRHRVPRGTDAPWAKLKPDQVLAIREDRRVQAKIAIDYGISQMSVSKIKRRLIWAHL